MSINISQNASDALQRWIEHSLWYKLQGSELEYFCSFAREFLNGNNPAECMDNISSIIRKKVKEIRPGFHELQLDNTIREAASIIAEMIVEKNNLSGKT